MATPPAARDVTAFTCLGEWGCCTVVHALSSARVISYHTDHTISSSQSQASTTMHGRHVVCWHSCSHCCSLPQLRAFHSADIVVVFACCCSAYCATAARRQQHMRGASRAWIIPFPTRVSTMAAFHHASSTISIPRDPNKGTCVAAPFHHASQRAASRQNAHCILSPAAAAAATPAPPLSRPLVLARSHLSKQ